MYKFIKAFFIATVVLLAVGTPPLAKKADVHNKAPGIAKVTDVSVSTLAVVPVMDEMYSLDVLPAPAAEYAVVRSTEESYTNTEKTLGAIKPPGERWCKLNTTPTKTKRPMDKWKDFHRRTVNNYV